ncbi:MAG: DnaD domain protein [Firmicutes bacterium]|nr:DnaD domain protein [Bacillota bacterium]
MFVKLSENLIKRQKISLDSLFIQEYMPYAPDIAIKVYLYGLSLFCDADNSIDMISDALRIDSDEVLSAFKYWENQGLISLISIDPPLVEYKEVVPALEQIKHYDAAKFAAFNEQLHAILKNKDGDSRLINKAEYEAYYYAIEHLHIDEAAMLAIIAYCVRLKGASAKCAYIMTVARNLAAEKITTFDKVEERLSEFDLYDSDIKAILKEFGRRKVDIHDKRLWIKWIKDWGFKAETIVKLAKQQKRGNIEYFDKVLQSYYELKLFNIDEIQKHSDAHEKIADLTKGVLKSLGIRMEDISPAINEYIKKWLDLGFDENIIMDLAKDCFKKNKRSLEYMHLILLDWKKSGIKNLEEGLKKKPPKETAAPIGTTQKSIGKVTQKSLEELNSLFD